MAVGLALEKQRWINAIGDHRAIHTRITGSVNIGNLVPVGIVKWHIPTLINTNVRGALSCKLDEIHTVAKRYATDIVCITETWCSASVPDAALRMPSYTCVQRDGQDGQQHGGIAIYLRDTLPFQQWRELDVQHLETVSITIELQRLLRGISNITIGLVYHPPGGKGKPIWTTSVPALTASGRVFLKWPSLCVGTSTSSRMPASGMTCS